ncbi:Pol polyprotein [Plakobranchus ocellatus]|uniref:Pol polyprotein n=1 Tax=Plakobranchus ocellatus TaxID=259542 RepID=A0AAV3YFA9_9GAST|nr:Pol polyprotein [Plakobranchus ocellatus]
MSIASLLTLISNMWCNVRVLCIDLILLQAISAQTSVIKGFRMASGVSKHIIKPFTGQGDVGAWIQKVELVAKLTKVKDVASFWPLYLEGNALAVYLELSDHDKSEVDAIKKALVWAFSDSTFEAFSKLKVARWTGEPVDVFANDIRRMARESRLRGDGLEEVVKLAFVTGFPDSISVELRQVSGIEHMEVSEILGKARVLASTSRAGSYSRGMAAAGIGMAKASNLKCYKCNGPHIAKECPRGGSGKDPVTCYRCGWRATLPVGVRLQGEARQQDVSATGAEALATLP